MGDRDPVSVWTLRWVAVVFVVRSSIRWQSVLDAEGLHLEAERAELRHSVREGKVGACGRAERCLIRRRRGVSTEPTRARATRTASVDVASTTMPAPRKATGSAAR